MTETIRIVGTGPVSLALRGFLTRQGFTAHELTCDAPSAQVPPALARRALALSLGSWQLLRRFAALPASAPIITVDVSIPGAAGSTRMTAAELGVPALGHVVRYGDLHRALRHALPKAQTETASAIPVVSTASTSLGIPAVASAATATATATATPEFAVTVVADGDTGEATRRREFDQAALLATVRAQRPAEGVAFERFTSQGPLAMLPLPEPERWSAVWCASPEVGRRRMELPRAALEVELLETFGPWLGALELCGERHLAPVQRRLRANIVRGTQVAIGNAAQSLHPVAGQGLNLGIRDAFVLAEHLGEARARGSPLADALPAFARARRLDRFAIVTATDALATLFTMTPLHPLESLALGMLDIAAPARRILTRTFMFGVRK